MAESDDDFDDLDALAQPEGAPVPPASALDIFIQSRLDALRAEYPDQAEEQLILSARSAWNRADDADKKAAEDEYTELYREYRRQVLAFQREHPQWEAPDLPGAAKRKKAGGAAKAKSASSRKKGAGSRQSRKRGRVVDSSDDELDGYERRRKRRTTGEQATRQHYVKLAREQGLHAIPATALSKADRDAIEAQLPVKGETEWHGDAGAAGDEVPIKRSHFEEMVEAAKSRRRKYDANNLDQAAERTEEVKTFLDAMRDACELDREKNRRVEPAVRMLGFLPSLQAMCMKLSVQQQLMDDGLLRHMRDWLAVLPSGALPPKPVRVALYEILESLPIDKDALQESEGLGKSVMALWLQLRDDPHEGRKLHALVEKWLRPILNRATNWKQLAQVEAARASELRAEYTRPERAPEDHSRFQRARVPAKAFHDYIVRPTYQGSAEEDSARGRPSRRSELQKRISSKR